MKAPNDVLEQQVVQKFMSNTVSMSSFLLPPGELHLWRIDLDARDVAPDGLSACLSAEELHRAERFAREADRRRFVVSHASQRTILGQYLATEPIDVAFRCRLGGKPELATANGQLPLRFNLSHSGEMALVAITRDREIGVDIEHIRPSIDASGIVERFFAPGECAVWRTLPHQEQTAAFFRCWTRKEAYLKARGVGLSSGLDRFEVSFAPDEAARLLCSDPTDATANWHIYDVSPNAEYMAACVVEGAAERIAVFDWPAVSL